MAKSTKFWFKNEKELMRSLGLNPTPGSGNRVVKEDGQNENVIAQLKSTEGSQITIKLSDISTLLYNATMANKLPIFINQFIGGPILISARLEDLINVVKYLEVGEVDKSNSDNNIYIQKPKRSKRKPIKSGNRKKAIEAIEDEKERKAKEYEKMMKERRRKR